MRVFCYEMVSVIIWLSTLCFEIRQFNSDMNIEKIVQTLFQTIFGKDVMLQVHIRQCDGHYLHKKLITKKSRLNTLMTPTIKW